MIWLTWRQFRSQAGISVVAVAAFAVLLALTEPNLARQYGASGISSCPGACAGLANSFLDQLYATGTYWILDLLGIVAVLLVPPLVGMFWGAPLIAAELEARTHYLVWNQSITRVRWLAVKLTLTGLSAMAVTEALSVMQAWWATPISRAVERGGSEIPVAMNQFSPLVFAAHGITPLGYAAFAFALGVTAGVLIRRTVPAMALTLAIFAVLQIVMALWIRPHLFPPDHTITTFSDVADMAFQATVGPTGQATFTVTAGGLSSQPEAWVLSSGAVNVAGDPVTTVPAACAQAVAGDSGLDCLSSQGIRVAVTYQPASRYWTFEWTESAIYSALALGLAGYSFWGVSRRRF
jgi:hypothetical protein